MGLVLHQTGDMTAWTQQEPGVLLAPKPGPGVETPSLGWTRQALVTIQTRTGCLDFEKFRSFGLQDSKIHEEHIVTALLSPALRHCHQPSGFRRPQDLALAVAQA